MVDTKVAPALQAAQSELERKKLEDTLDKKIAKRPEQGELVEQNILKGIGYFHIFGR